MKDDFICALSGVTPTDDELDASEMSIPEGWIEITVKRVFPNQRFYILQQLKNQAVNLTLAQIPEDQREEALESVRVQVDAQYFAYEKSLKEYEEESDVIYISPPENDESLLAEYTKLSSMLGFDAFLYDDQEDTDVDENQETDHEESAIQEDKDSTNDEEKG